MEKNLLRKVAKLHPDEVMHPFDIILKKHGFNTVNAIVEQFGGLTVYVPGMKKIFTRCLEIEAKKEFTGDNFHELAIKYGFSERHLRRILYV